MNNKSPLIIRIIIAGLVLLLLGGAVFVLTKDSEPATDTPTSQSTEYSNFAVLNDYGVSDFQLLNIEQETAAFVKKDTPGARRVLLNEASVRHLPRDPSSTIDTFEYTMSVDDTTYICRLDLIGIDAMQLTILDGNRVELYQSEVLQN